MPSTLAEVTSATRFPEPSRRWAVTVRAMRLWLLLAERMGPADREHYAEWADSLPPVTTDEEYAERLAAVCEHAISERDANQICAAGTARFLDAFRLISTTDEERQEKIGRLSSAFGKDAIMYADRADAKQYGYLKWSDFEGRTFQGASAWVNLGDVASGPHDSADQQPTWSLSNYRSLIRDYPYAFTPISYMNVNGLGAFIDDLSMDLVDILCGLKDDYPLYDESDVSELESELESEAWDSYLRADLTYDLRREYEFDVTDYEFSDDELRQAFYDACESLEMWAEFEYTTVIYHDWKAIVAEVFDRLCQAMCPQPIAGQGTLA